MAVNLLAQDIDIPDDWFYVQTALEDGKSDRGYWDIPGDGKNLKDANELKLWGKDNGNDRQFKFEKQSDGTYIIYCRAGNSTNVVAQQNNNPKNGLDVRIINKKYGNHKKWRVKHMGEGRFKLYGQNNYVLCTDGRKSKNGTNVHLWADHEGPWMEWVLIKRGSSRKKYIPTVKTQISKITTNSSKTKSGVMQIIPQEWFGVQSAMEKQVPGSFKGSWDVPGSPTRVNGKANLQAWNHNEFKAKDVLYKFEKQLNGKYYIYSKIGYPKYVCQVAKSKSENGTSFEIAKKNGSVQQQFDIITYFDGTIRILSHDGYVVCLAGRSSENKTKIHMWQDHGGKWTEWNLIDPKTGSRFFTQLTGTLANIKPAKTTGPNADKLLKDIDNAYAETFACMGSVNTVQSKASTINNTLKKPKELTDRLGDMEGKVLDTRKALLAVKRLPIIGAAATPVTLTLKTTANTISKVSSKVQSFDKPVINPTAEATETLGNSATLTGYEVMSVLEQLQLLKLQVTDKCNTIMASNNSAEKASFESKAKLISKTLTSVASVTKKSKDIENKISKFSDSFKPIKTVVDNSVNSTEKFMKVFGKTEKAADKINGVLDKKFKKKYMGKTVINISLRDVLTAGGAFKKAKKWLKKLKIDIDKWARKALKPVTDQLGKKIPAVPNLDKYYAVINDIKAKGDELKENANLVNQYKAEVNGVKIDIENEVLELAGGSSGKKGGKSTARESFKEKLKNVDESKLSEKEKQMKKQLQKLFK